MKYLLLFTPLILLLSCQKKQEKDRPALAEQVTIYRDTWGIPHIVGVTDEATMYGAAYARAEDEYPKLEEEMLSFYGRYAEFIGEEGIVYDIRKHAFELEEIAKKEYQEMPSSTKALFDAYAAGLNYYRELHPEESRLSQPIEPWVLVAMNQSWQWLGLIQIDWKNSLNPSLNNTVKEIDRGSNAWAIAPSRTKNGNAMLLINPHIAYAEEDLQYEIHLMSKEGLNVYGSTGWGHIMPVLGFNDHLGWSLTVNQPDVADIYEITFDHPTDSLRYRYGEEYLKAETWNKDIKVKSQDSFYVKTVNLMKTIHGPVFRSNDGNYYSYKLSGLDGENSLEQFYNMASATDLDSWKEAISMQALTFHNLTYADKSGNIFYIFNGKIPVRNPDFDWSEPVDGSMSDTRWQGYHGLDELPQLLNPSAGYVQNCNQSPFSTTHNDNPDPADYPAYFTSLSMPDTERAKRSRELLSEATNLTLEGLHQLNFDTKMSGIADIRDSVVSQWEKLKGVDATRYDKLKEPVTLWANWDLVSTTESIEAGFVVAYGDAYTIFMNETGEERPSRLDIFEKGVQLLAESHGSWKVPYGKLIRHQRSESETPEIDPSRPSYPTPANLGFFGTMFCMNYNSLTDGTKPRRTQFGNSFVAHVEFTKDGPKANSLLTYGNSSRPDSPHYNDQTEMFAKGEMKKVNFTMEDIMKNLEGQYKPGEEVNTPPETK